MARVRIVLVRPETAVNVGATARILRNTGLEELALVLPGEFRTVACWRTAWGAHDVLEAASVVPDLGTALTGAHYVAAFSGRSGETPSLDVRDAAAEVAALGRQAVAALVFGPETSGLAPAELALCGRRVQIPTHAGQPSLNLSHAVMVAGYEVLRARRRTAPSGPRTATHDEKEDMLALLRDGLHAVGALPEGQGYFRAWRTLVHRADLTPKELRLFEHMARKMRQRSPGAGDPGDSRLEAGALGRDRAPTLPRPTGGLEPESLEDATPYTDIQPAGDGFSIPVLKWRELLFVGALRSDGDGYRRDPACPLPPFRLPDLFPAGIRFRVVHTGGRVIIRREPGG